MKKFIKTKEDFVCVHCGVEVKGNGYTNHCPECLWSLHVDVYPGDRNAECGGMMEPVAVEGADQWSLRHRCKKCGKEIVNKVSPSDNKESLIEVATRRAILEP